MQNTILKYWNAKYQVAMADWQTVYQFAQKKKLLNEVYRGVFVLPVAGFITAVKLQANQKGFAEKRNYRL